MFIEALNHQERTALLATLAHLATLSGVVTEAETAFIAAVAKNLGVPSPNDIRQFADRELTDLLAPIQRLEAKRVALMELVNLGYADGEYCQAERAGVRKIAAVLQVQEDTLKEIEKWVEDGVDWTRRGRDLLADRRV
ncbi:MAG: TerB family tellurite resistance protein [Polyangiaceae bacterium]